MKIKKEKIICNIVFILSIFAIVIYPNTDGIINFLLYLLGITGLYTVGRYEGKHNL